MSHINENIFQNFCLLTKKVQKIQNKVDNQNVTPQIRQSLHKELEGIQGSMDLLRKDAMRAQNQAKQQFMQFDEVESQIISLYRVIEERFEEHEISLISKEAMDLGSTLESGKMFKVAKKVSELRHNILFLFKHRRPSMQHRKIVHLALKLSDHAAEVLLTTGETSKEHLKLIQVLKTLLKEAILRGEMYVYPGDGELAMDLYEIADLLYHKRIHEGRVKLDLIYSKLSRAQQRRLDVASDFPKEMVQILLEIADGDPCLGWEEKPAERESVIHVLQA